MKDRQHNGQKMMDRQYNGQKKDRQYNGQKMMDRQHNDQKKGGKGQTIQKTKDQRRTQTPLRLGVGDELRCSWRVIGSYFKCGTDCVTLVILGHL
jgi:hypothetical protein